MYVDTTADVSPSMRYRRHVEGTDFSLEANTEATPESGRFYLFRGGKVELVSEAFPEVMEAYQKLCKKHWQNGLESDVLSERMASAWGLVGLEPDNKDALEVIRTDGTDDDRKRLEQVRRRKRFAKRKPGRVARAKS
jgi:hypothetical protein